MSNSVRPHRWQPTRLPCPWDSPGKNTEVGCHFLLQCMKVKSKSKVAQLCLTLSDPWTAAFQASPSMGFSRQEYWSGVPLLFLSIVDPWTTWIWTSGPCGFSFSVKMLQYYMISSWVESTYLESRIQRCQLLHTNFQLSRA